MAIFCHRFNEKMSSFHFVIKNVTKDFPLFELLQMIMPQGLKKALHKKRKNN
jgi:hypothetical protein